VCEIVDSKEELLEDVPTRGRFWERRRGFELPAVPESEELEDFGGDGCSTGMIVATRS
jgi:hypothetical protein